MLLGALAAVVLMPSGLAALGNKEEKDAVSFRRAESRDNTTAKKHDAESPSPAKISKALYAGGYTQGAGNSQTFAWAGPTTSTVTATITTDINNVGEQTVVYETYTPAYQVSSWTSSSHTFNMERRARWHKNGGFTGGGTSVNNFIGRVTLNFSTPVPANEIYVRLYDMDNRGVDDTAPDGFIDFPGSVASPTDFEQLSMTPPLPADATSSTYNADGSIAFGIGAANADRNKYLAIAGTNANTVSQLRVFIRNVGDDVGIEIGWIDPTALPVRLAAFGGKPTGEGNLLNWSTAEESNFDRFAVQKSADGKSFREIGSVKGGASSYEYRDTESEGGKQYYRLKMIDTDGTFAYSKIIVIDGGERTDGFSYPNPADSRNISIRTTGKIGAYHLFDISGKEIAVKVNQQGDDVRLGLGESVPAGNYVFEYYINERRYTSRIVLK